VSYRPIISYLSYKIHYTERKKFVHSFVDLLVDKKPEIVYIGYIRKPRGLFKKPQNYE